MKAPPNHPGNKFYFKSPYRPHTYLYPPRRRSWNQMEPINLSIETKWKVTAEDVRVMLCCAFEGGSNYWYTDLAPGHIPEGTVFADYKEGGACQGERYWHWAELLPTVGGSVTLLDKEGPFHESCRGAHDDPGWRKRLEVDSCAIERGVQAMAEKFPRHLVEQLQDGGDADTGDMFLQCVLFGDVIYG